MQNDADNVADEEQCLDPEKEEHHQQVDQQDCADIVYDKDNTDVPQEATAASCNTATFPITLWNGIMLMKRTKAKVLRFVNFRLKADSENYYHERVLLYVPWKKEDDILGECTTYEEVNKNKDTIVQQSAKYEPMSAVLEEALREYDEVQAEENSAQSETANGSADSPQEGEGAQGEQCEHQQRDLVDIGPFLGVRPV